MGEKKKTPHWFCKKHQKSWTTLWLNPADLLPGVIDCWAENIRLVYHQDGSITNAAGVETRVPGFGETSTVETLSTEVNAPYLAKFVKNMVDCGYAKGESIAAATYDFRLTPRSNKRWVADTIKLVEKLYVENGNTSVAFFSHSMGSIYSLYFFQEQTQAWKDKYIHSWTSV